MAFDTALMTFLLTQAAFFTSIYLPDASPDSVLGFPPMILKLSLNFTKAGPPTSDLFDVNAVSTKNDPPKRGSSLQ